MLPAIFNENLFDNFFNDDFYMPSVFGGKNDPLYGKHAKNVMKTDVRETENSYELGFFCLSVCLHASACFPL